MNCEVVIASPWRTGMDIRCHLEQGHNGLHWAEIRPFGEPSQVVQWSGQHDRFTERERLRREKFSRR